VWTPMDEEMKRQFKDLMFGIMFLAMFLIFLSYIREYEDRITRLENMNETILNTRDTPNYYEELKTWEPFRPEIKELYESKNK
jgi:hypothetical protein